MITIEKLIKLHSKRGEQQIFYDITTLEIHISKRDLTEQLKTQGYKIIKENK